MQIPPGNLSRVARRLSLGAALYGVWLGVASGQSGCGDHTSHGTSGKRVALHTRVELAEVAKQPFTNGFAWQLRLREVELSVGVLRYFEGAAIGVLPVDRSRRYASAVPPHPHPRSTRGESIFPLGNLFRISEAEAHPGHYVAGDELGEMLTPTSVDLLSAPVGLPEGEGVTGHYRSGWFSFGAQPAGSTPEGSVARVVATASSGDASFDVEISASLADVLDSYGEPIVKGCPFAGSAGSSEAVVASDGTVVVTIDPSHWLDQLDLSRVTPPTNDMTVQITSDDEVLAPLHKAFARGLRQAIAYRFSFVPD